MKSKRHVDTALEPPKDAWGTPQEWSDTQTIKKIQPTVLNAEPRWTIIKTDLYQCSGPKMGAKINLINSNFDQMWNMVKKENLLWSIST